jgi:UDP-N-acetylmuramate dehydrogenase
MTAGHLRGELRINELMARHTSWRVGGPADRWYRPADVEDLGRFLSGLRVGEPLLWVGLGSNLLVRDGGVRGTVIACSGIMDNLEILEDDRVRAGAGVTCAKLARFCAEHDRVGGEFFAGIPGALGGALAMNAGAWGDDTWSHVREVVTIDRQGRMARRHASEYQVGYRSVRGPGEAWFVEAVLQFQAGEGARSRQHIKELLARRGKTQPIGQPSCGSVFRNPPGDHAARLIEACGLKGFAIGGAQVSEKHANFIINTGGARAQDIEDLMNHVRQAVQAHDGVALESEVRIVGEPHREARA